MERVVAFRDELAGYLIEIVLVQDKRDVVLVIVKCYMYDKLKITVELDYLNLKCVVSNFIERKKYLYNSPINAMNKMISLMKKYNDVEKFRAEVDIAVSLIMSQGF